VVDGVCGSILWALAMARAMALRMGVRSYSGLAMLTPYILSNGTDKHDFATLFCT
jgi:hypothetical protein